MRDDCSEGKVSLYILMIYDWLVYGFEKEWELRMLLELLDKLNWPTLINW